MKILPCTVFETGLNPFYFSDATCDEKCAFLYKNENVITGKENEKKVLMCQVCVIQFTKEEVEMKV